MTASAYKSARQRLGTQAEVASRLGLHRVTIAKREAGTIPITAEAAIAIEALPKRNAERKKVAAVGAKTSCPKRKKSNGDAGGHRCSAARCRLIRSRPGLAPTEPGRERHNAEPQTKTDMKPIKKGDLVVSKMNQTETYRVLAIGPTRARVATVTGELLTFDCPLAMLRPAPSKKGRP